MNTTSMEFVIAQDKTKKSPSVLSEFMGISKNMEEALLVNPWDLGVSKQTLLSFISPVPLPVLSSFFARSSPPGPIRTLRNTDLPIFDSVLIYRVLLLPSTRVY